MNNQKLETTEAFNALSRKEKISLLKQGIENTRIALEGAVNAEQRVTLYKDLGQLLITLEDTKMNKYNSPHFEFIQYNGYNRRQRKEMGLR